MIEVGGVGLLVQATPAARATLRSGERARVVTSLEVVREDALDPVRLRQRRRAGSCSSCCRRPAERPGWPGRPRSSWESAPRQAIAAEDVTALTRVPWRIGRKGAQRIVLELAGRLGLAPPGAGLKPLGLAGPGSAARLRRR